MAERIQVGSHLDVPIYVNNAGKFWCAINPDQEHPRWYAKDPNIVTRATIAALKREIEQRKAPPDPTTGKGGPLATTWVSTTYRGVGGYTHNHTLVAVVKAARGYGEDKWRTDTGGLLKVSHDTVITPADPTIQAQVEKFDREYNELKDRWTAWLKSLPRVVANDQGRPCVPSVEESDE